MIENDKLNKIAGLRPATLLKKGLWHRCFPVNLVKFLRTSFLQNTSGRLLLKFKSFLENLYKDHLKSFIFDSFESVSKPVKSSHKKYFWECISLKLVKTEFKFKFINWIEFYVYGSAMQIWCAKRTINKYYYITEKMLSWQM